MRKEPVEDRRKEYRHKICVDAQAITPKSSFEVLATNISGCGLEIQCPSIINPRTELMITLQLQEEFVFHGTVIWTLGDFVDNQWLYRVGIKTNTISFKDMSVTSTKEKAELVQRILPQIKAKGAGIGFAGQMYA